MLNQFSEKLFFTLLKRFSKNFKLNMGKQGQREGWGELAKGGY